MAKKRNTETPLPLGPALDDAALDERRRRLADLSIEYLDLKRKRRAWTKKANDRLKELEDEIDRCATEIKTRIAAPPSGPVEEQIDIEDAIADKRSA